jgi:hypothetical protein
VPYSSPPAQAPASTSGGAADGPGLEGESTTVLRPGSNAGPNQSAENEPTQLVSGDEPTAPVDDDGQRTQVIRPKTGQDDQPTERWG